MPALPVRKANKPFKPQCELKRKRTHARLRVYAKRRAQYANTQLLCFLIFYTHYHETLWHAWKEEIKVAARPGAKLRQRRHRKLQSILLRIAKLEMKRTELRAEIAKAEERVRVKAWQARKHAT